MSLYIFFFTQIPNAKCKLALEKEPIMRHIEANLLHKLNENIIPRKLA